MERAYHADIFELASDIEGIQSKNGDNSLQDEKPFITLASFEEDETATTTEESIDYGMRRMQLRIRQMLSTREILGK